MKLKLKYLFSFFVLIILFANCTPLFAQSRTAAKDEKLGVYELPSLTSRAASGYHVDGFELRNPTSKPLEVTIQTTLTSYDSNRLVVEKKLELLPLENRIERIRFPVTVLEEGKLRHEFIVAGDVVARIDSPYSRNEYSYYRNDIAVLIDKNIAKTDADRLFGKKESHRSDFRVLASYFEGSSNMLDSDWTAYGQFAALVFYVDTFISMPTAIKNAFTDYARAGGVLVLIGDSNKVDMPNDVRSIVPAKDKENPHYMGWRIAFGYINFLKSDVFQLILPKVSDNAENDSLRDSSRNRSERGYGYDKEDKPVVDPKNTEAYYRNGPLAARLATNILASLDIIMHGAGAFSKEASDRLVINRYLANRRSGAEYSGFITWMIIIFALFLGPINIYILHKKDKKIFIFFTVPLIAMFSIVFLGFYYFVTEYNHLDIIRQSITFLSDDDNKAITFGGETVMAGKNISDAFSFPASSIIIPNETSERRRYYKPYFGTRVIKLANNQILGEGWVKARSPISFCQTSITQDRARVEITAKNDSCEFFNGLGADIQEIIYLSKRSNSIYKGVNIEAGSRAESLSVTHKPGTGSSKFKIVGHIVVGTRAADDFSYPNNILLSEYASWADPKNKQNNVSIERFARYLKPGEYVASLRTNPFIKHDIDKKANVHNIACLVIGRNKLGTEK